MLRIASVAALALFMTSAAVAQGVAPGGPIGGSTAIGSGLGGVTGTGPSWPNGTNQAPQPSLTPVPPGGYASPAPLSTYRAPTPSIAAPSTPRPSPYPQPGEPYAASSVRPPATIPLVLPERPSGSLVFLKGCWRTDNFANGQQRASITWCFDDRGGGRYLYSRTDQGSFYCHAQAQARWEGRELHLTSAKPTCDGGAAEVPTELTCREGTDGALCSGAGEAASVRLYRVR